MDEWLSSDFVVDLSIDETELELELELSCKFSEKPSRPSKALVDPELYKAVNDSKKAIELFPEWDYFSRITNPYEKISKIVKGPKNVNRAFYKLYEILRYFECKDTAIKRSFHVCDAPGSFVHAMLKIAPGVDWYAQSLYSGGLEIDVTLNDPKKWIGLGNSTGNIYEIGNILTYEKFFENKRADLVTADGGFKLEDHNNQEQLTLQLIFSSIVIALVTGGEGSMFVCKIFDTVTNPTVQLLYLLTRYYEKVFIIKPRTSRYSNSEKYVVCIKKKGLKYLSDLKAIVEKWHKIDKELPFCRDFGIVVPSEFEEIISAHNNFIIRNQLEYIETSFKCKQFSKEQLTYIETLQNKRAHEFCYSFDLIGDNAVMFECKHLKLVPVMNDIKKCELCNRLVI